MNLNFGSLFIAASALSTCYVLAIDDEFDESWNEFEENQRDSDENGEISSPTRLVNNKRTKAIPQIIDVIESEE